MQRLLFIPKPLVLGLPFALITGVKFKNCTEDGMPGKEEFAPLYKISDPVGAFIKGLPKFIHAGTSISPALLT